MQIDEAIDQFNRVEYNLSRMENLFGEYRRIMDGTDSHSRVHELEELSRNYADILQAVPTVKGWKPKAEFLLPDALEHGYIEFLEIGKVQEATRFRESIDDPRSEIQKYRHEILRKRYNVIKPYILELLGEGEDRVVALNKTLGVAPTDHRWPQDENFIGVKKIAISIQRCVGSPGVNRIARWADFRRHIDFAETHDIRDIVRRDWPAVRCSLESRVYDPYEPVAVVVEDIADIADEMATGRVSVGLNWSSLGPSDFERLMYNMFSNAPGYENPQWLMHVNAPDRGRDLSVWRVSVDALSGTERRRVIVQCRHQEGNSVNVSDVATLKEQMKSWEPPRVDVLIVATSGTFTVDAVSNIEMHNRSDAALRIEMWPKGHLERILSEMEELSREFGMLRNTH